VPETVAVPFSREPVLGSEILAGRAWEELAEKRGTIIEFATVVSTVALFSGPRGRAPPGADFELGLGVLPEIVLQTRRIPRL